MLMRRHRTHNANMPIQTQIIQRTEYKSGTSIDKESIGYNLIQATERTSDYNERMKSYNKYPTLNKIQKYIDANLRKSILPHVEMLQPRPNNSQQVIPFDCYSHWHTQNLPPIMAENYAQLQSQNLELQFHLYDDDSCRSFIVEHFDSTIVNAYDKLVPSSYKSDLWRFCILYKYGGIYLDIKYGCVGNFKLADLCTHQHFVLDNIDNWSENQYGIYTACIVTPPNNPILYECIQAIIENVETNNYGWNALYPTGPGLLGQIYFQNDLNAYIDKIYDIELFYNDNQIFYKKYPILKVYDQYRAEQVTNQTNLHYSQLWEQNAIYKKRIRHVDIEPLPEKDPSMKTVLLIVHVGDMEVFIDMIDNINNVIDLRDIEYNLDVYFNIIDSISTEQIEYIRNVFPDENIVISENYGFDIGSFFHILDIVKHRGLKYDYVLKLHTKTDPTLRKGLLEPIAGSTVQIMKCIRLLDKNQNIGCIGALSGKCLDNKADFDRNTTYLQMLLRQYLQVEPGLLAKTPYVSGTMFWMRFELLESIFMTKRMDNIYNALNGTDSFDWVWYFHANKPFIGTTPFNKTRLHSHYIQKGRSNGLSGNLLHCIKHQSQSFALRDAMIEHAYERFFAYMLIHRGSTIYFL